MPFDVTPDITHEDGIAQITVAITQDGVPYCDAWVDFYNTSAKEFADKKAKAMQFWSGRKLTGLSYDEMHGGERALSELILSWGDKPGSGGGTGTGGQPCAQPAGCLSVDDTLKLLNGLAVHLKPSTDLTTTEARDLIANAGPTLDNLKDIKGV